MNRLLLLLLLVGCAAPKPIILGGENVRVVKSGNTYIISCHHQHKNIKPGYNIIFEETNDSTITISGVPPQLNK